MAVVTEPIILDETGQDIVTQLQAIVAGLAPNAGQISYSNATSGLSADDVQEAIDEVESNVVTVSNSLTQLKNYLSDRGSVSVQANTFTEIASVTLTKGVWLILTYLDANSSNAGVYISTIQISTISRSVRNSQMSGGGCVNHYMLSVDSDTEAYLRAYMPVACTARGTIEAIKIG